MRHVALRHAKFFCQLSLRRPTPTDVAGPDILDLACRQLGVRVGLAPWRSVSPALPRVPVIVGPSPRDEVLGVDAGWVVAGMANNLVVNQLAVMVLEHYAMDQGGPT